MNKYYLTLDLKNDPALIAEYEYWHQQRNFWPEIRQSIFDSGITAMEIYRVHDRLFMVMETTDRFDFEREARMQANNEKVQEWETLMWRFQQALPWAKTGEKWHLLTRIFRIEQAPI